MTMRLLEYFSFEKKKSALHSLDPRGKLFLVISLSCITIYFNDLIVLLFVLASIIPLLFLGKFFKKWLFSQIAFLPLLLLIIILNSLLLRTEHPTTIGIAMALRLVVLTAVFGLFFQTVSPNDLSQMLVKFKLPYTFAWAISTAYRFVPTIAIETRIIMDAQKSRGLQIDRRNIFKRMRNMIPLLIPIFASALRRSWQLAEAIESRGWGATKKRTYLYSLTFKWWDILVTIISGAIFGFFLYLVIAKVPLPVWMTWYIPERYELKRLFSIAWQWFIKLFS